MNTTARMIIGCTIVWVAVTLVAPEITVEIGLGIVAPLTAVVVSMQQIERIHTRSPRAVTPYLVKAFAAKMLLFGLYFLLVIGLLALDPIPFVASFTASFICLHGIEALQLHSLSTATAVDPSS